MFWKKTFTKTAQNTIIKHSGRVAEGGGGAGARYAPVSQQ